MAPIKISIFNDSQILTDQQVEEAIPALQTQISEHFAPAWGIDADLVFLPKRQPPLDGSWWLTILDDSDQARALGYHQMTPDGLPIGKVFAKTDLDNKLSWTVTASHELLEMLADPEINRTCLVQNDGMPPRLYALEVCDPVEDDRLGYLIGDVVVSNFLLPAYFRPQPASSDMSKPVKFDYRGQLAGCAPGLMPGGYLSEFDMTSGTGWKQLNADTTGPAHRAAVKNAAGGGRADRRKRSRTQWSPSLPRLVPMAAAPPKPGPIPARLVPMEKGPAKPAPDAPTRPLQEPTKTASASL